MSAVMKEKRMRRKAKSQGTSFMHTNNHSLQAMQHEDPQLNPPRRPFAPSALSSSSEITLASHSSSSSIEQITFHPPASTVRLVQTDMRGGTPMSRDSCYTTSCFSIASTSSPLAYGDNTATPSNESPVVAKKEPQMSWFLTISLLILVTGVCT